MNNKVHSYCMNNEKYRQLVKDTYSKNRLRKMFNRLKAFGEFKKIQKMFCDSAKKRFDSVQENGYICEFGNVKFYLPSLVFENGLVDGDYIQKKIFLSEGFYESEELCYLNEFLRKYYGDKKEITVCDIGANIGNHTLYFAKILGGGVKWVYSFEPVVSTFDILKKNIEINNLHNVSLYNCALGEVNGNGDVLVRDESNAGANSIVYDENGVTDIKMLDSFQFEYKIDFLKMDVEGFEKSVLNGAKEFLKKNHPVLYIEIFDTNYAEVLRLLEEIGYFKVDSIDKNYIFTYRDDSII